MRREGSGVPVRYIVLALLLVLPPAGRIGWHVWRSVSDVEPAPDAAALVEVQNARAELAKIRADARLPTLADPEKRYSIVQADVMPLSDPAPERSLLWVACRGDTAVPRDTAATWGGALAGRVVRSYTRLSLARVQTLLDPGFRVRFRMGETHGMLSGTGKSHEGHPLLELRYLSESVELTAGAPVHTEGNDGVYPAAVLIGSLVQAAESGVSGAQDRWVVRAALRPEELTRLELAVDARRADLVEKILDRKPKLEARR